MGLGWDEEKKRKNSGVYSTIKWARIIVMLKKGSRLRWPSKILHQKIKKKKKDIHSLGKRDEFRMTINKRIIDLIEKV